MDSSTPSQPTVTQEIQSPPPPKRSTTPVLIGLGVVLLVAAVGVGAFLLGRQMNSSTIMDPNPEQVMTTEPSTTSQKETWQTYTNTRYRYTIQYPVDWKVAGQTTTEPVDESSDAVSIFNPVDNPDGYKFTGMTITYQEMLGATTNMTKVSLPTVTTTVYRQETMEGEVYYINIPDTDSFLVITGAGGHTSNEQSNETLRKIFQTFRFDSANVTQTGKQSWKTYTNTTIGFSIQYPIGWSVDPMKEPNGTESITISNKGYSITMIWLADFGPGGCIFQDQPEYKDFEANPMPQFSACEGKFSEFVGITGLVHRRSVRPAVVEGKNQWAVYTKNSESNFFVTVPPTKFEAPIQYDETMVKTLESILQTYTPKSI